MNRKKNNMRMIKNKDTKIELILRKELWKRGYRYRKNVTTIFGKPDIVFIGKKVVVFCDSEFWHGYDWENKKLEIKSNREFWWKKIEGNIKRDKLVTKELENQNWTVLRFWGKDIKNNLNDCIEKVENAIKMGGKNGKFKD